MIFNFQDLIKKDYVFEINKLNNYNPKIDTQVDEVCNELFKKLNEEQKGSTFDKQILKWTNCRNKLLRFKNCIHQVTKAKLDLLVDQIKQEIIKDKDISEVYSSIVQLHESANLLVKKGQASPTTIADIQKINTDALKLFPLALNYFEFELATQLLNLLIENRGIEDAPTYLSIQLNLFLTNLNSQQGINELNIRIFYDSLIPKEFEKSVIKKCSMSNTVLSDLNNFKSMIIGRGEIPKTDQIKKIIERTLTKINKNYLKYKEEIAEFYNLSSSSNINNLNSHDIAIKGLILLPKALRRGEFETSIWIVKELVYLGKTEETLSIIEAEIKDRSLNPDDLIAIESLNWLKRYAESLPKLSNLEKDHLSHLALPEGLGFGYKTANLHFMHQQLDKIVPYLENCGIEVPNFLSLSHSQIQQHLLTNINFKEINRLWNEFLDSFNKEAREKFTNSPNLQAAKQVNLLPTLKGIEILDRIQEKLTAAFEEYFFHSPLITQWLEANPCEFVIVRSTGREDSESNANAGGNASIPFVIPHPTSISKAIGKVIASYYGEKSITQRLQAGDKTLFTEAQFLPVLIQKMVCEKNMNGKGSLPWSIPRSGVLFTREQGKADVIMINAALGSNEGVVSSQVAVDTYLIHSGGIYRVIRLKDTRFVQQLSDSNEVFVGPVPNNSKLARESALTDSMVMDLEKVTNILAKIYGGESLKCMDMEFTISFNTKKKPTINLLQIRPLISTEQSYSPSFINAMSIPQDKKIKTKVLMAGTPVVRRIENYTKQVIFADDLPKALREYQSPKRNAHEVSLVIVRKTAPITSHESVMFRPTNIPIMVVDNTATASRIQNLLCRASKDHPILACPQRGLITEEFSQKLIQEGLISYPGFLEFSVPSSSFHTPTEEVKAIFNLLLDVEKFIKSKNESFEKVKDVKEFQFSNFKMSDFFDFMAMEKNPVLAEAALVKLLSVLYQQMRKIIDSCLGKGSQKARLENLISNPLFRLIIIPLKEVFEHTYKIAKTDVWTALNKYPAQSMNRLFYLKILQALVMQESSNNIVSGHSFGMLRKQWKTISNHLNIQCSSLNIPQDYDNYYLLFMKEMALSNKVKNKWDLLIQQLNQEQDFENRNKFLKVITTLNKLNILTPWMNTKLQNYFNLNNLFLLDKLESSFNKEINILDQIKLKLDALKQFTSQEANGNWSNPKFVNKSINDFQKIIHNLGFDGIELAEMFSGSEEMGKFAAIEFCHQTVTVYDSIIKSVKGSGHYENVKDKAEHIGSLLKGFLLILQTVMKIAEPFEKELMSLEGAFSFDAMSFSNYINSLENGRKEYTFGFDNTILTSFGLLEILNLIPCMSEEDIKPTLEVQPGFNASAIAIGSHADLTFSVIWPSSLEEHFTTIHQSIESIVRFLRMKSGFNHEILPESTYKFTEFCNNCFGTPSGIVAQNQTIEVYYQIPLRQHAASVIATLPKNEGNSIQLSVAAFGNEEHDRWKHVATFGAILVNRFPSVIKFANDIPPSLNYDDPKDVSFTLEIPIDRVDLQKMIVESIEVLLKSTTMDAQIPETNDTHVRLIKAFKTEPKYLPFKLDTDNAWINLHSDFFANSLLMNLFAMNQADDEGQYEILVKIAMNTLRALKRYNMADFSVKKLKATGLENYYTRGIFKQFGDKESSFAESAILYIIKACEKNPDLLKEVDNDILHDKTLQDHFESFQFIQICSFELKSFEEKSKILLQEPANLNKLFMHMLIQRERNEKIEQEAISKLKTYFDEKSLKNLDEFINGLIENKFSLTYKKVVELLIEIVKSGNNNLDKLLTVLYQTGLKNSSFISDILEIYAELEKTFTFSISISSNNLSSKESVNSRQSINEDWSQKFQLFKMKKERADIRQKTSSSFIDLSMAICKNLPKSKIPTLSLLAEKMIQQLIQLPNPMNATLPLKVNMSIIENYLGNAQYGYFENNFQAQTNNIHTIVTFILVHVLENIDTRKTGIEIMERLIEDYKEFGYKDPGASFVKEILFNLTIALINQVANENPNSYSDLANKYIICLWGKCPEELKQFHAHFSEINDIRDSQIKLTIGPSSIHKFPLKLQSDYALFTGPAPLINLNELTSKKITQVVMLLDKNDKESKELIQNYLEKNIEVTHFPIKDRGCPRNLGSTFDLVKKIIKLLETENLFIHCFGGKGRTGTIAACVAAILNPKLTGEEVIKFTREAIENSIETLEQEKFVKAFVNAYTNKDMNDIDNDEENDNDAQMEVPTEIPSKKTNKRKLEQDIPKRELNLQRKITPAQPNNKD